MLNDLFLQFYWLKYLMFCNCIMIISYELVYFEDGMFKDCYWVYYVECVKVGVVLMMMVGLVLIVCDSLLVFNNILVWKDEVVGWMKQLVDECYDYGVVVMIQLMYLGCCMCWDKVDWLLVIVFSYECEVVYCVFFKWMEDWDIVCVIVDFVDVVECMKVVGVDGIEFEVYGYLLEQFWLFLINDFEVFYGGSLENWLCFIMDVLGVI